MAVARLPLHIGNNGCETRPVAKKSAVHGLVGEETNLSRRAALTGGAMTLTGALLLSGCSEGPALDDGTMPMSAPAADIAPPLKSAAGPAPQTGTELEGLLAPGRELVVGGARLNVVLLKRFYGRHDFAPVWTTRRAQADALAAGVLRAGAQGLNPELFHATQLRNQATLPLLERDLLLSDAILSYAQALAHGAVPVDRRRENEVLAPEPVDVAAVLDDALDRRDPADAIEALAPTTPTYLALREALQTLRPARSGGGPAAAARRRTIEVNLERQRWLPRRLPAMRAWVNVADERLTLYRADLPVFSTRVVVGEDVERNQSPEFRATIDASFYNPPWVIPADIAKNEILPKLDTDPEYLTRNKMILLANGEVEQLPGPEAGLGLIMFDMPNRFDVYLHDTPDREIFARANRRISHGCIRVQNPRDFAALLMDQPLEAIDQGIAGGNTTRHALPTPVPVFVVYQTAFADAGGALLFRPDFYKRDAAIWQSLQQRPSSAVEARAVPA